VARDAADLEGEGQVVGKNSGKWPEDLMTRVAIRGWKNGVLVIDDHLEIADDQLDVDVPQLAERHAKLLADAPYMIEVEFLDELNIEERFFRFGTDPRRMVKPLTIDLTDI
jgi:hypothetical protein